MNHIIGPRDGDASEEELVLPHGEKTRFAPNCLPQAVVYDAWTVKPTLTNESGNKGFDEDAPTRELIDAFDEGCACVA